MAAKKRALSKPRTASVARGGPRSSSAHPPENHKPSSTPNTSSQPWRPPYMKSARGQRSTVVVPNPPMLDPKPASPTDRGLPQASRPSLTAHGLKAGSPDDKPLRAAYRGRARLRWAYPHDTGHCARTSRAAVIEPQSAHRRTRPATRSAQLPMRFRGDKARSSSPGRSPWEANFGLALAKQSLHIHEKRRLCYAVSPWL